MQRKVKALFSRVSEVDKSQEFLSKTVEESKHTTKGISRVIKTLKKNLRSHLN